MVDLKNRPSVCCQVCRPGPPAIAVTALTLASILSAIVCRAAGSPGAPGLFPAGKKQASVRIPALVLSVAAEELQGAQAAEVLSQLDDAVAAGATAVLLSERAGKPS